MENAFSRCSPYKWSNHGPPGAIIPARIERRRREWQKEEDYHNI